MNKIQNIKVLFWDIDNTLLDFDAGAEDSMKQAFADLGLEFKPERQRNAGRHPARDRLRRHAGSGRYGGFPH